MIVLLLFLAAAYSGWSIGANDSGNCVGTIVGGGVISFRKAIILVAVFVVLGAVLQGQKVMKTVGKGIIISSSQSYQATHHHPPPADFNKYFPTEKIPDLGIFVALLSAAIFVSLATYSSIPVSTSQSIVGGVAGVGLGIVGFQAQYFKIGMLVHILGSWVICPLMTMILAFLIYALLNKILQRAKNFYAWNGVLKVMVIMAAAYSAYSLGANDVGNAIGPILNKYPDKGFYLTIFGGLVLADFYRVHNKLLTEKDLEKYDKNQLNILRNSLFARRGVTFTSPKLRTIFSYMPWYRPSDISSAAVFDEQMSEQEKANVKLMLKMEKR